MGRWTSRSPGARRVYHLIYATSVGVYMPALLVTCFLIVREWFSYTPVGAELMDLRMPTREEFLRSLLLFNSTIGTQIICYILGLRVGLTSLVRAVPPRYYRHLPHPLRRFGTRVAPLRLYVAIELGALLVYAACRLIAAALWDDAPLGGITTYMAKQLFLVFGTVFGILLQRWDDRVSARAPSADSGERSNEHEA